jgi:hypothetical protein
MIAFFAKAGVIAAGVAGVIAVVGAGVSGIVLYTKNRKLKSE